MKLKKMLLILILLIGVVITGLVVAEPSIIFNSNAQHSLVGD